MLELLHTPPCVDRVQVLNLEAKGRITHSTDSWQQLVKAVQGADHPALVLTVKNSESILRLKARYPDLRWGGAITDDGYAAAMDLCKSPSAVHVDAANAVSVIMPAMGMLTHPVLGRTCAARVAKLPAKSMGWMVNTAADVAAARSLGLDVVVSDFPLVLAPHCVTWHS